jgi:hypothetical protein
MHEGWEVHRMDVKSTLLNRNLQEEVCVEQLAGFTVAGMEHKVLKMWKEMYGLHQTPWAWNTKLDDTLLSLGFQRTPSEHAIYVWGNGVALLVVGVDVDDIVIIGFDCNGIKLFKEEMAAMFKISDLDLLRYYLDIEVK